MKRQTEIILDTPVDILTIEDIKKDMDLYFKQGRQMTLTSVNPQIILMGETSPVVKKFIEASTHRFPDGIGLIKISKWTKGQIKHRVAGIDVMVEALAYADEHQKRIFLYGAKPEVVKAAAKNIQTNYPNLILAGYIDGYTKLTDKAIVQEMNESQAEMIFVALGSPKQEIWLAEHMKQLSATIFQTVGGSLDVLSGTVKRAPNIFIKTNLEWLYRSVSNPKRFNRIFQVPEFVIKAMNWHRKNGRD